MNIKEGIISTFKGIFDIGKEAATGVSETFGSLSEQMAAEAKEEELKKAQENVEREAQQENDDDDDDGDGSSSKESSIFPGVEEGSIAETVLWFEIFDDD